MSEVKVLLQKITGSAPRVGLGAVILNPNGEVLMCRRGAGPDNYLSKLHLFGGKLELGESMKEGIIREIIEETDIDASKPNHSITSAGMIEEIEPDCSCIDEETQKPKMYHWISSVWVIRVPDDHFVNVEPHKHSEMGWYDLEKLSLEDLAPSAWKSLGVAGFHVAKMKQDIVV